MLFHVPTARPAAMAAPRAVVSRMAGRFTGMLMRLDWICGVVSLEFDTIVGKRGRGGMGEGEGNVPA